MRATRRRTDRKRCAPWPQLSFEDRMATVEVAVAARPHIVVDKDVCSSCTTKVCVTACPANLFVPTAEGGIVFNYETGASSAAPAISSATERRRDQLELPRAIAGTGSPSGSRDGGAGASAGPPRRRRRRHRCGDEVGPVALRRRPARRGGASRHDARRAVGSRPRSPRSGAPVQGRVGQRGVDGPRCACARTGGRSRCSAKRAGGRRRQGGPRRSSGATPPARGPRPLRSPPRRPPSPPSSPAPPFVVCGDYSPDERRGHCVQPCSLRRAGAAQALGLTAAEPGTARGTVVAERRLDGGRRELLRLSPPTVMSVETGAARLRRAPLPAVVAARTRSVEVVAGPVGPGAAPRRPPVARRRRRRSPRSAPTDRGRR